MKHRLRGMQVDTGLPLFTDDVAPPRSDSSSIARETITAAKVLIVDDQVMNIEVLTRLLKRVGFTNVTGISDPRHVVSIFQKDPPDILLLDLNMPDFDGFEVMEQLEPWILGSRETYLPVLVLTSDITRSARERSLAMGANDFLTKPLDPVEVQQRIENLLETRFLYLELTNQNESLEQRVLARTADLWETVGHLEQAKLQVRASEVETVTRLSAAAEFRDDGTARHIIRMGDYCALLMERAGGTEDRCELMRIASRMHDIGKIGTPDSILLKPGPLTDAERATMQEHARNGYKILAGSQSELLQLAATIALTHHEKIDGSGYPQGLREGQIPLEGRMAAVADVFDALTTDRVYKDAMPPEAALDIMTSGSGHLDADLLNLFRKTMPDVLVIKQRLDLIPTSSFVMENSST